MFKIDLPNVLNLASKMGTKLMVPILVCVAGIFGTTNLNAQSDFGTMTGTVTDTSGAVVVGAPLTLTKTDTNEKRETQTNANGLYNFVNLIPGVYQLEINQQGFARYTQSNISIRVQTTTRIDAQLKIGAATQSVEVTTQAALIQADSSNLSSVIEGRQVTQAPLNGRNVMSLVVLVPGVIAQGGSQGNPAGNNPQGWGNFQFGGSISNQGAIFFDGVLLNTNYGNQPALVPTQDMIKEFAVSSNSTGAEYGNTSGGVVNMASKSGTNDFHVLAYEYIRNKVLNANLFFNNRNKLPKSPFTQNQYGMAVGGPFIKNKAFFFFSWEAYALRQGNVVIASVPTDNMRNGNFTGLSTIYDPCAGSVNAAGLCSTTPAARTAFAGNQIPASRISPVSQSLLQIWPHATDQTKIVNNFTRQYSGGQNYNQYNVRGDYVLSQRQNLFVRYGDWRETRLPNDSLGTQTSTNLFFKSKQAVVGDSFTLNPTTIFDFRVAFTRYNTVTTPQKAGLDQTTIGLPPSYNAATNRGYPAPCIVGEFTVPACTNNLDLTINGVNNNYEIDGGATKILGRHTIKAGLTLRTMEFNFGQTNYGSGFFNFDSGFTNNGTASTAGTGDAFASYLLAYYTRTGGSAVTGIQQGKKTAGTQWYQGYYATDTWQVSSKLTANLGLRWEIPTFWKERHDSLDVFLPDAASPLGSFKDPVNGGTIQMKGQATVVNSPAYSSRYAMQTRYYLFSPRIGIAYRALPGTVIRSGFGAFAVPNGVAFGAVPALNSVNSAVTNPLFATGSVPLGTLTNPFPNGFLFPGGHSQAFVDSLYGSTFTGTIPNQKRGYNQQWNLAIQQQIKSAASWEIAYAGAAGVHLPNNNPLNQIGQSYLSQAAGQVAAGQTVTIAQKVNNPLATVANEPATTTYGQLLLPFPQYLSVTNPQLNGFHSSYHALQTKFEQRFANSATLLLSYTWSKFISNTDTQTTYLESNGFSNNGGPLMYAQNPRGERSISAGSVPQLFIASYNLDVPVGKGRRFLGQINPIANTIIGGWGVNGITTYQVGFPLTFTVASIPSALQVLNITTERPSVVPGCTKTVGGSAYDRVSGWFNKGCFYNPGNGATVAANGTAIAANAYLLGNEPRVDPTLRQQGYKNWDFAAFKNTKLTEKANLEFRAEFFNLFNTTRFAAPNTSVGNGAFGTVTAQGNQPRLVQFALRLSY